MTTNLFSTYRQGENRVTATFLAVLQRLSLPNIDRILGALSGETSFSLVSFENQPPGRGSRPDAKIGTGSDIWIETKTSRGAVGFDQIRRHLEGVAKGENLILLTPDDDEPKGLPDKVVWSNFRTLADKIKEKILEDEEEPPSEKEAFLLRELVRMFRNDSLIDTADTAESRVLVVAARWAWPMYELLGVYRCQAMRSFQASRHIAFYADGEIKGLAPRIKSVIESIDLTHQEAIASLDGDQKEFAGELLKRIDHYSQHHEFGKAFKVMFLSQPDNAETMKLPRPIINDKEDKNGQPTPFTYGAPRYVTLESMRKARKTSQLELC